MTIDSQTKSIEILLGNPRKAVVKLAIPYTVSLLVMAIYQITDIIWVSGLGTNALSIVGFATPFMMLGQALSNGLWVGCGTNLARKIGENDKKGANSLAEHAFIVTLIVAILFLVFGLTLARPILKLMGVRSLIETSSMLVYIYCICIFIFLLNDTARSILSNEGDAIRAMLATLAGVVLNIILDPILIYSLGMGVIGSGVASAVSLAITSLILIYWFFIKKNTYVSFQYSKFLLKKKFAAAILKQGFPVILGTLSGVISRFILTGMIYLVGGLGGVAVFSTGFRYLDFIQFPANGISHSVITISAAALGAGNYYKLKDSFIFALKISITVIIFLAIGTYIFSPQIATVFTWSENSAGLSPDLILFLKQFAWLLLADSIWMTSVCFFVGIGRSSLDFIFNSIRSFLFVIPMAYLFGIVFNHGTISIWRVIIIGMWLQGIGSVVLAIIMLLKKKKELLKIDIFNE